MLNSSKDHLGNGFTFHQPPSRIISAVPSQTESLTYLGLSKQIVGITKFCIHPKSIQTKPKIGGTKNLNLDQIRELNPDIIIANKEENTHEQISVLMNEFPVWISDISNLKDNYRMLHEIGRIHGKELEANELCSLIQQEFRKLKPLSKKRKTLYLIWRTPYMTINSTTFIHDLLELCGLDNVAALEKDRYPVLTPEQIKAYHPEIIILSSEPFPFREKHVDEIRQLLPSSIIELGDGEMFSWYGSRLLKAPDYFNSFLRKFK